MDEYISRPSLMGQLTCSEAQSRVREMTREEAYAWVLELVNVMPAGDVVPVRHGRWIPVDYGQHKCSICHTVRKTDIARDHCCPNCFAKMDWEESE